MHIYNTAYIFIYFNIVYKNMFPFGSVSLWGAQTKTYV